MNKTRQYALIFHRNRPITAQLFTCLLTNNLCHAHPLTYLHFTLSTCPINGG